MGDTVTTEKNNTHQKCFHTLLNHISWTKRSDFHIDFIIKYFCKICSIICPQFIFFWQTCRASDGSLLETQHVEAESSTEPRRALVELHMRAVRQSRRQEVCSVSSFTSCSWMQGSRCCLSLSCLCYIHDECSFHTQHGCISPACTGRLCVLPLILNQNFNLFELFLEVFQSGAG